MSIITRDNYNTGLQEKLLELRNSLKRLTPDATLLLNTLHSMPESSGLTRREENALIRGLERVWHIMRLLNLLSNFFKEKLVFGGGVVLNYIYMVWVGEPPRLTFDLDASWYKRVSSKRLVLLEMAKFNRWLSETGNTLMVPVSPTGKSVQLYIVEYDSEKDFFPSLLSLRMPVITRYDGRPFYRFLGIKDYKVITSLRNIFKELLGVRDARIDYIRLDISLEPQGTPPVILEGRDLLGYNIKAPITPIEYQLAMKIKYKLARNFGDALKYNIHDILKAILDLRLLKYLDKDKVLEYVGDLEPLRETITRNVNAVLTEGKRLWERNYHYTLIRRKYTLEDIVKETLEVLL